MANSGVGTLVVQLRPRQLVVRKIGHLNPHLLAGAPRPHNWEPHYQTTSPRTQKTTHTLILQIATDSFTNRQIVRRPMTQITSGSTPSEWSKRYSDPKDDGS